MGQATASPTPIPTTTPHRQQLLKAIGALPDASKARDSKALRAGKGKMRNRRYVVRKGPLVIYANDSGISKAFRNLPGVEVADVSRLNLLQLAPGGHLGRFCVWTKSAFEALDKVYGTTTTASEQKKGYTLPRPIMANADVARLINSDEVQSVVRPPKEAVIKSRPLKKNPLKNLGALVKLNPHAIVTRRNAVLAADRRGKQRAEKLANLRAGKPTGLPKKSKDVAAVGKAFYKQMVRRGRARAWGSCACGRGGAMDFVPGPWRSCAHGACVTPWGRHTLSLRLAPADPTSPRPLLTPPPLSPDRGLGVPGRGLRGVLQGGGQGDHARSGTLAIGCRWFVGAALLKTEVTGVAAAALGALLSPLS